MRFEKSLSLDNGINLAELEIIRIELDGNQLNVQYNGYITKALADSKKAAVTLSKRFIFDDAKLLADLMTYIEMKIKA